LPYRLTENTVLLVIFPCIQWVTRKHIFAANVRWSDR
jgi:hypothetical protein